MPNKPWLQIALIAAALASPLAGHATTADHYAYAFPLQIATGSDAYRIELNADVYAHALPSAGLLDMVVVNASGHEVPFAPMPAQSPAVHPFKLTTRLLPVPAGNADKQTGHPQSGDRDKTQAAPENTVHRATQTHEWLIDAGRPVTLKRIALRLPDSLGDVALRLVLATSNDLQHWSERASGITIVRIARGDSSIDRHTIALDGKYTARYYRLRLVGGEVSWGNDQTLETVLIGSYTDTATDHSAPIRWITLQATTPIGDGRDFDYRLSAALPIKAVKVIMAEGNTTARFKLSGSNDSDNHHRTPLGSLTATRIAGDADSNERLRFQPRRLAELHVHTDTPLTRPPELKVGWQPATFVFLAQGRAPYRLLVGSYDARRGTYPIKSALQQLRGKLGRAWQPPLASLGQAEEAAGHAALAPPKAPFDWTRPLLWCVLILAALLVASMAFSLLRRKPGDDKAV